MQNRSQQVSRGLNTIAARVSKNEELLNNYGVALYDTNGELRSTYDVLLDLSNAWETMSTAEQLSVGQALSGVNQYRVFSAVMSQMGIAQESYKQALEATGATEKQNEVYMASLQARVTAFKTEWESLVLEGGVLNKAFKLFVDLGTIILKLANNDLVQLVTTITLVGVALTKANALIELFKTRIITAAVAEAGLDAATLTFSGSIGVLTKAFLANAAAWAVTPFGMVTTAAVAIYTLAKAFDVFTESAEESREKISELREASKESESEISSLEDKIKQIGDKIKEINDKKLEITDEKEKKKLDDELLSLKAQTAELKTKLKVQQKINEENNKAEEKQTVESSSKKEKSFTYETGDWTKGEGSVESESIKKTIKGTAQEQFEKSLTAYKDYANKINEINQQIVDAEKKGDAQTVQSLGIKVEAYERAKNDIGSHMASLAEILETQNESLYGATKSGDKLKETNNALLESYINLLGVEEEGIDVNSTYEEQLDTLIEKTGYSKDQIKEYAEQNGYLVDENGELVEGTEEYTAALVEAGLAMQEAVGSIEESVEQVNSLGDTLSKLESDYNSLSAAIADFNDGNGISAANLDKLIELAREHADAISFDNGQIHLNEEAFQASANAAINDAEAKLIDETQSRLTAVAQNNLGEALNGMGNAATNAGTKSDSARVIIQALGDDAVISAAKIRDLWNALDGTNTAGYSKDQKKAVEEIGNYFTTAMNGMEAYRKQISTSYSKAASGSAKSSKGAAKESKDAWLEAYKEEKDAIDSMYKTGVISSEEYSAKLQELAEKYFLDSEEHQEKYSKELRSLYEDMYKALQKAAKESLDEMKDAHKKAEDAMKKTHKAQEENLKKAHDTEERLLKKAHEAQEKAIKDQIELLKRQKDAVKDSYDAQIEALKREREEYENQLKLMQLKEELAKAQQQYQYVMDETGRFNYLQDQNAVDKAQEELYEQELKLTYERQLQDLEDARDAAVSVYEQQIQDLEDYYDRVKEINDEIEEELKLRNDEAEEELKRHNEAQEEALSAHNDETEKLYEKAIENYDTYAEMMANGQLSQIANENANWATRLTNLASFVNNYNALLNKMGDGSTGNSAGGSFSGGTGYTKNSKSSGGGTKKAVSTAARAGASAINKALGRHAMGIAAIDTDEIALVGDSPNQELAIGSKINGIPLSMDKGSGVVNAKSTRTLAGLLNSIPNLGNNYNTTNNSNQQSIHIDNINLPQVQNGSEFINYLKNFDLDMVQLSF